MKKSEAVIAEFKDLLGKSGVSQIRAAQIINIHPQTLSRILAGATNPSIEVFDALVELTEKLKKSGLVAS